MSIFAMSVAVLLIHFAISVVPHLICCRSTSPPLPYTSPLSRIYAIVLVRRCIHRWPHLPSLLSRIYTAPPSLSYRVYVAVLVVLSSIVPCTLPCRCLSTLSPIVSSPRSAFLSVLHRPLRSTPHYLSHSLRLWSFLTKLFFSLFLAERLYSLSLWCSRSAPIFRVFFLRFPSLWYALIWSFPSALYATIFLIHLWYAQLRFALLVIWCARSDLLWSACSDMLYLFSLCTF